MEQLIQSVVNGLSLGSIMALSAIALTLTYGILRLSNFAHGDLMTLGAYYLQSKFYGPGCAGAVRVRRR
jgi:branched-subunit amino acid ABC-type transport system permease component